MLKYILLFTLLLPTNLCAAPDEVSRKLMNSSVSLMDFGCLRMGMDVQEGLTDRSKDSIFSAYGNVYYNFKDDKINIDIAITPSAGKPLNWSTYKRYIEYKHKSFKLYKFNLSKYFSHNGYKDNNALSKDDFDTLLSKIYVRFLLMPDSLLAEDKEGKLVFFEVDDPQILKAKK